MQVTRVEIAEHVEASFLGSPVSRAGLLAQAERTSGRAELLALLRTLPDRPYNQLRELWTDLRDVPIDLEDPSSDRRD